MSTSKKKKSAGLYQRGEYWYIDKQYKGNRISGNTFCTNYEEAHRHLFRIMEKVREEIEFGKPIQHNISEGIGRYIAEHQHKKTIKKDQHYLHDVLETIGDIPLAHLNMNTLMPYIKRRQKDGVKNRTINSALQAIRQMIMTAHREWFDNGYPWLQTYPKIRLLAQTDTRQPYPISWQEQKELIQALPSHLAVMCLFKINTGTRDHEVSHLQWKWEIPVPELQTSVFLVPGEHVKNGSDRLIVLNSVARCVIDGQRGKHPEYVFTYRGNPIGRINNNGWKRARNEIGLPNLRVHDLKHTYGMRLRNAGIDFETRQELLGHTPTKITSHYSSATLKTLIEASEKANLSHETPTMISIKRKARA